ncbi:MAG TPA: transketolase, partial [Candidatus Pacearchaeota archaeon]|nr:transketolase [Candidatus Pacearchaeota archaeon]
MDNLIIFYDNNHITIEGKTSLAYSDDVQKRFESLHWNVLHVNDVNNLGELETAIKEAQYEKNKPTLIITNTVIGFGSPNKHNTSGVHGSPLGEEEVKQTKQNFGWDPEKKFYVPEEVYNHFNEVKAKGEEFENKWNELFEKYKTEFPNDAELFNKVMNGDFSSDWISKLPEFKNYGEVIATRAASGKVINAIKDSLPTLIGGSAEIGRAH